MTGLSIILELELQEVQSLLAHLKIRRISTRAVFFGSTQTTDQLLMTMTKKDSKMCLEPWILFMCLSLALQSYSLGLNSSMLLRRTENYRKPFLKEEWSVNVLAASRRSGNPARVQHPTQPASLIDPMSLV